MSWEEENASQAKIGNKNSSDTASEGANTAQDKVTSEQLLTLDLDDPSSDHFNRNGPLHRPFYTGLSHNQSVSKGSGNFEIWRKTRNIAFWSFTTVKYMFYGCSLRTAIKPQKAMAVLKFIKICIWIFHDSLLVWLSWKVSFTVLRFSIFFLRFVIPKKHMENKKRELEILLEPVFLELGM